MMPDISDALAYAEKGWPVIPVPAGQKNPSLAGWPSKATTDPDQIAQWWEQSPDSNIAVLTGKKSGIVVLDIDGDKGKESFGKLISEHSPLPNTYTEKTPNGTHYFFTFANVHIASRIGLLPGIDVLSDKRCVVVAPSVVAGKPYTIQNDAPLACAPEWIVKLTQTKLLAVTKNFEHGPSVNSGIPKGERNNRLFRYVCSLRAKGLPKKDARTLMLNMNAEACSPPLPKKEVLNCFKSAWKYSTSFPLNDTGNARRLVALFGDLIRKPTFDKRWLLNTGDTWRYDDDGEIVRLAKEVVDLVKTEARNQKDETRRKQLIAHAKTSGSRRSVESMINLAESESGTPVTADRVDADPYLIGLHDEVFDLRKQRLTKTEQIITKRAAVRYDQKAICPRWLQFLEEIFAGDEKLINYVQLAIGYSLTGRTDEQCLFFLYGTGANGKSVFLSTIRFLLGEYAVTAPPTVLLGKGAQDNAAIARLHGARFAVASEVGEDSNFDEVTVKQLTGGDAVSCRHLYMDYFEYMPQFKLWVGGNYKPKVRGTDYAIWRRLKLIPFNVTFPEDKRDPKLEEKLKKEAAGIFNWAVEGFQKWSETGLQEPKIVTAATSEYHSESDIVGQFLDEKCILEPEAEGLSARVLYQAYRIWCGDSGTTEMSANMFGRKLAPHSLTKVKVKNRWHYQGIRFAE
jgi:putative DNA primase/helicase